MGGGGGKRIVRFWGGKRTMECALRNQFWRPQKVGSSGLCRFPLRKTTGENKRGGKRIIGRGSKNRFGKGFYPEFSTPLCFSLTVPIFSMVCGHPTPQASVLSSWGPKKGDTLTVATKMITELTCFEPEICTVRTEMITI